MIPQARTTIEDRVMIFLYFFLIWSRHSDKKVAGLKSGCGRRCTLVVGNYFSHNLRISPVGFKIKKENHNLHIFKNRSLVVTDVLAIIYSNNF